MMPSESWQVLNLDQFQVHDLKKSLNINPESAVSYFQIGNVYQDSNNFIDAKHYYNQSILLFTDNKKSFA